MGGSKVLGAKAHVALSVYQAVLACIGTMQVELGESAEVLSNYLAAEQVGSRTEGV